MKKFILKILLFTGPIFVLYFITFIYYTDNGKQDLYRLGNIPNLSQKYRSKFTHYNVEYFTKLSVINPKSKKKSYNILTIGDSFSEQGASGYKNFLARDCSVLHVDRFISNNQVQTLLNLCNGDFFDNFKIKYVILQQVERSLTINIDKIKMDSVVTIKQIDSLINNQVHKNLYRGYSLFTRLTLSFPLYYLPKFYLCKNYLSNNSVYNYNLNNKSLFSNDSDKLLFYFEDIVGVKYNNKNDNCRKLNDILNAIAIKLEEKGTKLIFLPAPDKYNLYYDFIVDKKGLPKPLFYDKFKEFKKQYIYIDSKTILTKYLNKVQDLYYFDDTHWSVISSKIIAEDIKKQIE